MTRAYKRPPEPLRADFCVYFPRPRRNSRRWPEDGHQYADDAVRAQSIDRPDAKLCRQAEPKRREWERSLSGRPDYTPRSPLVLISLDQIT
jgi:hypothetical protein